MLLLIFPFQRQSKQQECEITLTCSRVAHKRLGGVVSFTMKVYVLVFVHKPKTIEKRKNWLQHILKRNYCARKTQNIWHNSRCLGKENEYCKCLCIKLLLREIGGGRHWTYFSISLDTCYKTAEKVQILMHAESFMERNMHCEYSSPSPSH